MSEPARSAELTASPLPTSNDVVVGTSFSQIQCGYLGLDWREAYLDTLKMGFDIIRLGAYWSHIEPEEGKFDFRELDWQIKEASQHGSKILLTVGMKAPRWPEFFIPHWVENKVRLRFGSDVSDNDYLQAKVLKFITTVVDRYKNEKIIFAWQVENEPLNRSGAKELWIGRNLLQKEIDTVKNIDPADRPIVLNSMTYPNHLLRFFSRLMYKQNPVFEMIDMAEVPALNIYPVIGHKLWGQKVCFWSSAEGRSNYIKPFKERSVLQGKDLWITELQAEPWEPGELVHIFENSAVTCGPEVFIQTFRELRSLNIRTIFLWGVEYWIHREKKFNDDSWISAGRRLIEKGF